jgi:hypothetical protein
MVSLPANVSEHDTGLPVLIFACLKLKRFFRLPGCGCHMKHTTSEGCDIHGKCLCKENYDGTTCGKCKLGYADFPTCRKLGKNS